MKYPAYITEEEVKRTKKLFNFIRQTQNIEEAFLFKKLSLVAAYGQMYASKISYREFLNDFENYLYNSHNTWRIKSFERFGYDTPLVSHFWAIGDCYGTAFWVTHEHIIKDDMEQLEDAIIEELKKSFTITGHEIYTKYRNNYNNILKEYETRRSK